jgi:hypothetical protein
MKKSVKYFRKLWEESPKGIDNKKYVLLRFFKVVEK